MFKRIVVISPHTDDGELGCGASISKFIREKREVFHFAFSDGRPIIDPAILLSEFEKSNNILEIPRQNRSVEKFEIRSFSKDRQAILDKLIYIRKNINPDLVFLPCSQDLHQDHKVIMEEGLRAFKLSSTIFGYEEPWNTLSFRTTCFIDLQEQDLIKKIYALECYDSQKSRYYFSAELMKSLALIRGTQINSNYAEAFELIKLIMR